WAAFGTTGQRCTACSRVLVHEKVHDDLVQRVAAKAKQLKVGDGLDPATQMGPLINKTQVATVQRYVDVGRREAALVTGGEAATEGALAKGSFYKPTVFANAKADARRTGNGHREAGHTMLDPFTEWKSIYVDFSGRLQRAQIDNN